MRKKKESHEPCLILAMELLEEVLVTKALCCPVEGMEDIDECWCLSCRIIDFLDDHEAIWLPVFQNAPTTEVVQ